MSDVVQQIKDKLNIVDIISPYVELHKAGKNFKGKSPFAAEKTPSFYVSPDRGMYYCFSTSQGGDIFNFVQVMEGVDFKEALKILAEKAGVELVPEDPDKKSERERLYSALEEATVFYQNCLLKDEEAQDYLKKRGIKKETLDRWKIGFAPGPPNYGWREGKEALEARGFRKDELLKAGLIKTTEGGKEPFDVFRDRIMFPMADAGGKVVAFSGRILHVDDKSPKYVNSPETELYKKSELLYGYDKAKTGIRNLDFSMIVEGQFDVVMCHQAGYLNTVAVSGTALTLHHVQLLERVSDKVVLALDADRAGINAMKKGADLMLRRGLDVKVAELPLGKDPADIIKENPAEFKKFIGHSVHVIEFLLHVLRREITDDRSFKLKVREEVLPFVLLLPSRIDQEHFVKTISEYIHSTLDAVRFELDRLREKQVTERIEDDKEVNYLQVPVEKGKSAQDNGERAYLFLLASAMIVGDSMSARLNKELAEVLKVSELEKPAEADLAKTVFILEQQFGKMSKLAIREEIVSKLNRLKTLLIRGKLAVCKDQLRELHDQNDTVSFDKVIKSIGKYESLLKDHPYGVEMFD